MNMAGPVETNRRALTGDDIVGELLRNFEAGLFKIRYTTLAPCRYNVHLSQYDYDALRPVFAILADEGKRALTEALAKLNQPSPSLLGRALGMEPERRMEYKTLEKDWSIDFYPDSEGRLDAGEIEVYSELGSGQPADIDPASMTTLITRRDAAGETSRRLPASAPASRPAFALIRYEDDGGRKEYAMAKDAIVIGRGGKSFWVDVKVDAKPDVSREHCRIRRDPASGRFYLKDVSRFGTSVDGQAVPSSMELAEEKSVDTNVEILLPPRARIGLADVVFLDFEAAAEP
jgi:hypothetical protein